jgi:hypothetical protein
MSGTLTVAKLAIRFFGFCDLLSQLVQFGYRGFKDREPVPQIRNPIFGVILAQHLSHPSARRQRSLVMRVLGATPHPREPRAIHPHSPCRVHRQGLVAEGPPA